MDERDADGVTEFCRRHGISKGYLYSLWRRGYGPRFMQAGDRRLISREAGADWRRELEAESRAGTGRATRTNTTRARTRRTGRSMDTSEVRYPVPAQSDE